MRSEAMTRGSQMCYTLEVTEACYSVNIFGELHVVSFAYIHLAINSSISQSVAEKIMRNIYCLKPSYDLMAYWLGNLQNQSYFSQNTNHHTKNKTKTSWDGILKVTFQENSVLSLCVYLA